jgi:prepilin-type N-terminal cleavage/methylation domain-containing protein
MAKQGGCKKDRGFTLMELMIAVILIGVIAGFGIPNYQKAVQKGRERSAILHLKTIYGANEIYRARAGSYAPGSGLNLTGINSVMAVNIVDTSMTYSYTRSSATTYSATAAWTGTNPFTVRVNQNPITASNPCCSAGTCLIVPNC